MNWLEEFSDIFWGKTDLPISEKHYKWIIIGCVAICLFQFFIYAYLCTNVSVGDDSYWLLNDDIMITQRYAHNLANGDGLVYNVGDKVEGFSNPAVVFLYGLPLELINLPVQYFGLGYLIINIALHTLITLMIIFSWSIKRNLYPFRVGLALVYLTAATHGQLSGSGFSIYLQCALVLFLLSNLRWGGLSFFAAFALLPLVHAITYPIWLGIGILRVIVNRENWLREVTYIAIAAIPLVIYFIFRLSYYGEFWPNTYYMKASDPQYKEGIRYIASFFKHHAPIVVILGIIFVKQLMEKRWSLAGTFVLLFAVYLGIIAKSGGDLFEYRIVFILLPVGLFGISAFMEDLKGEKLAIAVCLLLILQLGLDSKDLYRLHQSDYDASYKEWHSERIELGLTIDRLTPPDSTIALFGLGYAGYLGNRATIDMLGKTDYHIARTQAKPYRKIAHQKDDPAYVMRRKPDFIECKYSPETLKDIPYLESETEGTWGFWADLALNPVFREEYMQVRSSRGGLKIYGRKDKGPHYWKDAPNSLLLTLEN